MQQRFPSRVLSEDQSVTASAAGWLALPHFFKVREIGHDEELVSHL